ncbi:MAG: RNA polymerase sigma-70 factor [Bacteroidota bacterium]
MQYKDLTELREEKELVILLRDGDEQAFATLYRRYSVSLLKKLVCLVKDEETAKELLQDIFLKIWEKRAVLDPERSFGAFLFRIAGNKVIDHLRKAACDRKLIAHITRVATGGANNTEESINFRESNAALQMAINSLPPQRKKIFILCKLEGRSYDEVAQLLGISSGTVNDHVVKATRLVKHYFIANEVALLLLVSSAIGAAV